MLISQWFDCINFDSFLKYSQKVLQLCILGKIFPFLFTKEANFPSLYINLFIHYCSSSFSLMQIKKIQEESHKLSSYSLFHARRTSSNTYGWMMMMRLCRLVMFFTTLSIIYMCVVFSFLVY